MNMFSLENKTAVITGSGQGIGLAIVERFLKAGAKVVMADINEKVAKTAQKIGAYFVKTDVSKEDDMKKLMQAAYKKYGSIDIIVNNAGVAFEEELIEEADAEKYKRIYDINTISVLYGMKLGLPYMKTGGAIVNTCSLSVKVASIGIGSYTASKAAILGLTKTAALEFADKGIRVNCICPTTIDTPMARQEGQEILMALNDFIHPMRRVGQPEEVAAVVHFLASDDAGYVTGQAINIDGGYTAGIALPTIEAIMSSLEQ